MPSIRSRGKALRLLFTLFVAILAAPAAAQPTPDQQAAMLLTLGRKAYVDGNAPFAAEKFREFIQKFGGHRDVNAARYGLGLAILDLPGRDYAKAIEALSPPSGDAKFSEQGLALYYTAVAQRGLGLKEVELGLKNPGELATRQTNATRWFTDAGRVFGKARQVFTAKGASDLEWSARARCDEAEMELRLNKFKEAKALTEPFVKDAALEKSKYRPLGLYYLGFACFSLNEFPAAFKALNQLSPFDQSFGPHARYLLGRVHAASGENAEAAAAFDAVVAGYDKQKKEAVELLKQPDRFKTDPWEKSRLEALVRDPAPDYVPGAVFHGACLNFEAGRIGEALPKFQAFAKEYATSPLKGESLLRVGMSLVQLKQYDDAVKALVPMTTDKTVDEAAFYWLGRAQAGRASMIDPNNAPARLAAFNAAINSFKNAALRASQRPPSDPDSKPRRGDILIDLGDTQLSAKQPKEAAATFQGVLNENLIPTRNQEVLERLISAHHLGGDYPASESRVAEFKQKFPQSPLLPLVLFRSAENAYASASQLAKLKKPEAKAALAEAAKRYGEVIAKFPEFDRVSRCRFGLALCLGAAEEWEKAIVVLEALPAPERVGDLAGASLIQADCLIRSAPIKAEDALQDNMLREKMGVAAALLDGFIAANPKLPETAEALLKLGFCHKRLGIQLADPKEKNEALAKARATFERLNREFPRSPAAGTSALERAKVMALQGDRGGAMNALAAFNNEPLKQSSVAALALLQLATLQREQNQFPQAVTTLSEARSRYEGILSADPERAEWVKLLRYHHGVALFEAGKPAEGRAAFDLVISTSAATPIGVEAALRACQCLAVEAKKKIEAIEKEKQQAKADQLPQIDYKLKVAKTELLDVARLFERRAAENKAALPLSEARARMLYDAAWIYRSAGENALPAYTKLIAEFPDLSLAIEARLELAELAAEKGKAADAVKYLKEAIDKEPTDKPTTLDTTERIRLRLGAVLFGEKDYPGAQSQFDSVARNLKSPYLGQAVYRSAECFFAQGKFEEAKEKLKVFRDDGKFHNVPGVSDRAMLQLGRSLLNLKQWEPARQAFEVMLARYGNSTWATDSRYGMGLALKSLGRLDEAANAFAQVTQATADERSGQAHMQVGLCRAAQKRWTDAGKAFAAVYYGFDRPELKYPAMLEHAKVLVADKKPTDATKLLERIVKEAPADSEWTKAAKEMLKK